MRPCGFAAMHRGERTAPTGDRSASPRLPRRPGTLVAFVLVLMMIMTAGPARVLSAQPALSESWGGGLPYRDPVDRTDVVEWTLGNATVGLCSGRHSCASLGCQSPSAYHPFPWEAPKPPPACHCDPACPFYGDCCHDYDSVCPQTAPPGGEVDVAGSTKMQLKWFSCLAPANATDTFTTGSAYLLVSSCPEGERGTPTAERCENPDPADVLASLPCHGRSGGGGTHYRNLHCALCHGETLAHLLAWQVLVYCGEDDEERMRAARLLLAESVGNLERVRRELHCGVFAAPPGVDGKGVPLEPPRQCIPDIEGDRCRPSTALPLARACGAYTALATLVDSPGRVFRNPHCALCEGALNESTLSIDCSGDMWLPEIVPDGEFGDAVTRGGGFSFGFVDLHVGRVSSLPPISILFDFRSDSSVMVERLGMLSVKESVHCSGGEVYDPFASRCRRLSCGRGYLLSGDRCVPDFRSAGRACLGDEAGLGGRGGVVIGLVLSLDAPCTNGTPDAKQQTRPEDFRACLAEFLSLDGEKLETVSAPTPGQKADCKSASRYSFRVEFSNRSIDRVPHLSEAPFQDSPLCGAITSRSAWSVELSQHCLGLTESDCTGRWLNESEAGLADRNDSTLVHVETGDAWYPLDQAKTRTTFRVWELSFQQSAEVQICPRTMAAMMCPRVTLNSSLFQDDAGGEPGAVVYTPEGIVFGSGEYIRTESGDVEVCSFLEKNGTRNETTSAVFLDFDQAQAVLSLVGNVVSMVASALTFLTYCLFKELRQRISLAIMALVACLFAAQLLLLVSGSAVGNPRACAAVAALGHFFWLATVFWTGVLAVDLNRTFGSVSQIRRLRLEGRVYVLQCAAAFGGALLIVLICAAVHACDCVRAVRLSYGSERVCWIGDQYANLLAFGLPIALVVLVNGVLFAFTVRGIRSTKRNIKELTQTKKSQVRQAHEELFIYIKISSLMGFTWVFGFAAAFSDVLALWYLFILFNSCQGLLVFLSFVCNRKVGRLWWGLLRRRDGGRAKSGSHTPAASKAMLKARSTKDTKTAHTHSSHV